MTNTNETNRAEARAARRQAMTDRIVAALADERRGATVEHFRDGIVGTCVIAVTDAHGFVGRIELDDERPDPQWYVTGGRNGAAFDRLCRALARAQQ